MCSLNGIDNRPGTIQIYDAQKPENKNGQYSIPDPSEKHIKGPSAQYQKGHSHKKDMSGVENSPKQGKRYKRKNPPKNTHQFFSKALDRKKERYDGTKKNRPAHISDEPVKHTMNIPVEEFKRVLYPQRKWVNKYRIFLCNDIKIRRQTEDAVD